MATLLGPHQLKAIQELHNGSVLKGGVGTGKSRTALAYFFTKVCGGEIDPRSGKITSPVVTPRDVIIITTARKRDSGDWVGEAARFGFGPDRDISTGSIQLTVDSWNNIGNYVGIKDAFVIFDEQRLVGSGAWVKAFLKIAKANQWIVLSATPGDTWMDYIPIFIANGYYHSRREFVQRHVVFNTYAKYPKVDHYVEVRHLVKIRNSLLVEMPYARATIRHVRNYIVQYAKDKWDRVVKDRWNIYEERPVKTISELFYLMRKVVNSDVSRSGALMELMEKHPRLIVFYNFDYELEMLRVVASSTKTPMAEWNGHKHQEIPDTERWIYLVQYTSGSEAWNCILTDAMVFWSQNYSYKVFEQSQGRIDRLNTPFIDLWYYVLRSESPIDDAIAKAIITKRNFNEKEFTF